MKTQTDEYRYTDYYRKVTFYWDKPRTNIIYHGFYRLDRLDGINIGYCLHDKCVGFWLTTYV